MPGHLFEGNPVDEDTTRRDTDTPMHRPQRPAGSTKCAQKLLFSLAVWTPIQITTGVAVGEGSLLALLFSANCNSPLLIKIIFERSILPWRGRPGGQGGWDWSILAYHHVICSK